MEYTRTTRTRYKLQYTPGPDDILTEKKFRDEIGNNVEFIEFSTALKCKEILETQYGYDKLNIFTRDIEPGSK